MWIYYGLIFIVIGREWWVSGRYDESGSRCHQFYHVSNTLWGATARDGPRRRDTKRICLLWWGQRRYVLLLTSGASQHQEGGQKEARSDSACPNHLFKYTSTICCYFAYFTKISGRKNGTFLSLRRPFWFLWLMVFFLPPKMSYKRANGLIFAKSRLEI